MRYFAALLLTFFISSLYFSPSALSYQCGDAYPTDINGLNEYIDSCNKVISENQGEQQTLKQTIAVFNSKISLAQAQINQTQTQIDTLEKDIFVLSEVLETVNLSMDQLAQIYITRVRESYKKYRYDRLNIVFTSQSLGDFVKKLKYLNTLKAKDQLILTELERSRLDYGEKKNAKVEKQQEVEQLKLKLLSQRRSLDSQKMEKQRLLTTTQNDEKKYTQLRADAQAQLAAFSKFVSNQGGAGILSGTTKDDGGWGKYYNQRDNLWGNKPLGSSNISVADAGCLISSMAMVMTHYGKTVTPGNIAANPEFFSFADFKLGDLVINGSLTNRTRIAYSKSIARSVLNEELNKGKPVIVGIIRYGSSKPEHFLVIKSREGDDYIMNDPFPEDGMNIKFTSKYALSDIATVDRITVN